MTANANHPSKPKIHETLRLLMSDVGITEAALARKAGIPQPTLHRILSGSTKAPRADSLSQLANYFSVSISVITGDESMPKDRIPGTHNPNLQNTIPLISWEKACNWPEAKAELQLNDVKSINWVSTDAEISDSAYALEVSGDSMLPRFPKGAILIVDPEASLADHDFVIVKSKDQKKASFKQLLMDGDDKYLKPLNPEFKTTQFNGTKEHLDVVVQTKIDLKR